MGGRPVPLTEDQKAAIARLYCEEGKGIGVIAKEVRLAQDRVRDHIWENALIRLTRPKKSQAHSMAMRLAAQKAQEQRIPAGKERMPEKAEGKPNPVAVALATLGSRLTERNGGYWLDNKPARFMDVMRETNRIRKACAWPTIDINPLWRAE